MNFTQVVQAAKNTKTNWDRVKKGLPPVTSNEIPILPAIGAKNSFRDFNRIVGNPLHPATLLPCDMLDYQIEYNRRWNTYHKVIFNKSRKIGATETAFRTILQNCYGAYMGHNVMIIAGNRQRQANKILEEFKHLLYGPNDEGWKVKDENNNDRIWKFNDLVDTHSASLVKLNSGVQIETYPGDATAVRGPANVKCVFITEAAHFDLIDDNAVYNALRPLAANDPDVDFILESTPNGKRGFFYDQFVMNDNFYNRYEVNYEASLKAGLLTREFIEQEKKNPRVDFEQEYNCKFTSSRNAAIIEDNLNQSYIPRQTNDWSDILGH